MKYGPAIEVNGKRPAWLADDELCQAYSDIRGEWYRKGAWRPVIDWGWTAINKIRLPADHWAYLVIDKGYWPWAGGDTAPDDWDGGEALCRDGSQTSIIRWYHNNGHPYDVIGYKRKVVEKIGPMSAGVPNELLELREKNAALEAQLADAIAKYPDLAPDPDRALKDEILAFCKEHGWNSVNIIWETPREKAAALLYAWAKRHDKPCTLTPGKLAKWRLEQARRIAADTWDEDGKRSTANDARKGIIDSYNSIRSALAVLTEYNITPEMVK